METTTPTYTEITNEHSSKTALEKAALVVSWIFNPFMATMAIFVILFTSTYLRILPVPYKQAAFSMTFNFTAFIPLLTIFIYFKLSKWKLSELNTGRKRFIPYLITLVGHITCIILMHKLNLPPYMPGIVLTATCCLAICILLNLKWKICTHTAASGLLTGFSISFGLMFDFNPLTFISLFILLSGILGSARMIAGRHSLFEIFAGFMVGMFCGINGILFI